MVLDIRSPEFRRNPYPFFRRLRAEAPICRIEPYGHWAVSRHADVFAILRKPGIFLSSATKRDSARGPELLIESNALIGSDPPDHTRLRALVSKAFTPGMVRALEPRIRLVTKALVANMHRKGVCDLVEEFSMPLPVTIISWLLGIDAERKGDFKRWSDTLITWRNMTDEREIREDIREMFDYFTRLIDERRRSPKEDLVSALVHAREGNQALPAHEVMSVVRLLLVAGNETTTNLIGNTLLALISHPEIWDRARRNMALVPDLIEESLRFDGPTLSLSRRLGADTELAGVRMAKDELVLPLLASANHDESVFAAPQCFIPERKDQGHLAFGAGIHYCLGAPLARLQARVAFEELLGAFESIERVDGGPLDLVDSFFFRGVRSLKIAVRPSVGKP